MKPKLTSVDSIFIPVKNREFSMQWYVEYFGLEIEGDHLKIGHIEVFFLETLEDNRLIFTTKDWKAGEDYYKMPAFCFKTDDIDSLHRDLAESNTHIEEIVNHSWFKEFDFYDCDGNKIKVWQPNN